VNNITDNKHISYSQFRIWNTCRRQWWMTYVDKLGGYEANIYGTFGQTVHEVIQYQIKNGRKHQKGEFKSWFDMIYKQNKEQDDRLSISDNQLAEWSEIGEKHIEAFNKRKDLLRGDFIESEYSLYTPINRVSSIHFKGFIDLLYLTPDGDRLTIYDIKTSSRGWGPAEKSKGYEQLALYAYYLRSQTKTKKPIRVGFIIFNRKKPNDVDATLTEHFELGYKASALRLTQFVQSVYDREGNPIADKIYANPSNQNCRFCPYRNDGQCEQSYFLRSNNN